MQDIWAQLVCLNMCTSQIGIKLPIENVDDSIAYKSAACSVCHYELGKCVKTIQLHQRNSFFLDFFCVTQQVVNQFTCEKWDRSISFNRGYRDNVVGLHQQKWREQYDKTNTSCVPPNHRSIKNVHMFTISMQLIHKGSPLSNKNFHIFFVFHPGKHNCSRLTIECTIFYFFLLSRFLSLGLKWSAGIY